MTCWRCRGVGSRTSVRGDDETCSLCEGNATLALEPDDFAGETSDIRITMMLVHTARERHWSPTEWLEQPWRWAAAAFFVLPQINEYRERNRALKEKSRRA